MASQFLTAKLADKFSALLGAQIPVKIPARDKIDENTARLYFKGAEINTENLRRHYKFQLIYYSSDCDYAVEKIGLAENEMRTGKPEIFSNNTNSFFIRYSDITVSHGTVKKSSDGAYFYADIKFCVTL